MVPTAYAHRILSLSERLMTQSKILTRQLELLGPTGETEIRLGVSAAIEQFMVAAVVGKMLRKHPKIGLRIETGTIGQLISGVSEGRLDLVITPFNPKAISKDLETKPFVTDPFALVARSDHPLSNFDTMKMAGSDFYQYPFVMPELSGSIKKRIGAYLDQKSVTGFVNIECQNFAVAEELARTTNAIAAGPRFVFEEPLANGQLVELKRPMDAVWNPSFLYLPESGLSQAISSLISCFEESAAAQGLTG